MQIAHGNYPHLIALNKFKVDPQHIGNPLLKDIRQLEKFTGFCNLKFEKITLNDLKSIKDNHGNFLYDVHKTRILASPLIYQILRNSDFLSFDVNNIMGHSNIKANYLFVNDIDKNKLHLFIKDNNGINYPVSFINREHTLNSAQLNYFIENQMILKIEKIEVLDFKNKELLEVITPGRSIHTTSYQEVAAAKLSKDDLPPQNIKEKIIDLYNKEFPTIRHIKESTANLINSLNEKHDHIMTVKEIKDLYNETGKKLEQHNNEDSIKKDFNSLSEIVEDLKHSKLIEKQILARDKAIDNNLNKTMNIEM
jgi:hypothetical protein